MYTYPTISLLDNTTETNNVPYQKHVSFSRVNETWIPKQHTEKH